MRQFPPPGLDARDSFFAVEAPADTQGNAPVRRADGPGYQPATLLIRTYAALLQSALDLRGHRRGPRPLLDAGRLLQQPAGARRRPMQVQDDVNDRLELIAGDARATPARTGLADRADQPRALQRDIPRHLKRMEKPYPDPDALDVILATNMISVGVDIDRLGLMVVMGQPQSTSEYIQATSRVGRQYPGLVVTLLQRRSLPGPLALRIVPGYHSALYRQVESTSVTPFSPRARDRALHAVLIALARLTIPGLADNDVGRRGRAPSGRARSSRRPDP